MSNYDSTISTLDVPYFEQSRAGTCGPAALMMVMKFWDNSIMLTRELENQLWMKSNPFIFFGGTLQFGLARTAVKMGFQSKIFQKDSFSNYKSNLPFLYDLIEKTMSYGARHEKVPIIYGKDIIDIISDSLNNKIPPIVFLNLLPILDENVLHWLVVTGMHEQYVYVNDPYVPRGSKIKKNYPIKLEIFKKAISTDTLGNLHMPPCILLVYK